MDPHVNTSRGPATGAGDGAPVWRGAGAGRDVADAIDFASLFAGVTGNSRGLVEALLVTEEADPGSSVARAMRDNGVRPYAFGPELARLYGEGEAFLVELAVWNRHPAKRGMRRWVRRHLARETARRGRPLEVLAFGDGIGVDALDLALAGHRVTFVDLPGKTEQAARALFGAAGADVRVVTDPDQLQAGTYDAITCFDVLEHVPGPRRLVEQLAGWLRDGGVLLVHAPFYLIHPRYPTHLRENRRYSGSLALFEGRGLALAGGRVGWNPVALRKGGTVRGDAWLARRSLLRAAGAIMKVGRFTSLPFYPLHALRRRHR